MLDALIETFRKFVFTDRLTIPLCDALSRPNSRALLLVSAAYIVETLPFLMLLGNQLVVLYRKESLIKFQ